MDRIVAPDDKKLFDFESPMAIELRRIMIRLEKQFKPGEKRVLMVTSAERGEGKSLFSLHFTLVLAYHLQQKILLIDGDVRRPVQHTAFQVSQSPGLAEYMMNDAKGKKIPVRSTQLPNLFFLPAGRCGDRPSRLLAGGNFADAIKACTREYDIIILDAPPVVPVSDPLHYLDAVDGVVYMVMAGRTSRDLVTRGVEILRSAEANILGVVANNMSEVMPYYYDLKYYGYGTKKHK